MVKLARFFHLLWVAVFFCILIPVWAALADPIIIDHRHTDINQIPLTAIEQARSDLHIGYGHTSHGSQLITGMRALANFANAGGFGASFPAGTFAFNNGGTNDALDLEEGSGYNEGWLDHDGGYYPSWVDETREYLEDSSHEDVNVIMWSWCGQASGYTEQQMIDRYLNPMAQLEQDYPDVTFVYMTGHVDGSGDTGNLTRRNQQIRDFCTANEKVLFDFADIETYDPDNNYYLDKNVDDALYYDSDDNGSRDSNWASQYLAANPYSQLYQLVNGTTGYSGCGRCSHSPEGSETNDAKLNCVLKGRAIWWLWARLSGWDGNETPVCNNDGICDAGESHASCPNDCESDTTPPSVPTDLQAATVSTSQIDLTWTASTDNVGVTAYRIYRNDSQTYTATDNSYSNTGLSPETEYTYTVTALDAAGNESNSSNQASATTENDTSNNSVTGESNDDDESDGCFIHTVNQVMKIK